MHDRCSVVILIFQSSGSSAGEVIHNTCDDEFTSYNLYDRRHSSYPEGSLLKPRMLQTTQLTPHHSPEVSIHCGQYCDFPKYSSLKTKKEVLHNQSVDFHDIGFSDVYLKDFASIVIDTDGKDGFPAEEGNSNDRYLLADVNIEKVSKSSNHKRLDSNSNNEKMINKKNIAPTDLKCSPETIKSSIVLQSNTSPLLPYKFLRRTASSSQYRSPSRVYPKTRICLDSCQNKRNREDTHHGEDYEDNNRDITDYIKSNYEFASFSVNNEVKCNTFSDSSSSMKRSNIPHVKEIECDEETKL